LGKVWGMEKKAQGTRRPDEKLTGPSDRAIRRKTSHRMAKLIAAVEGQAKALEIETAALYKAVRTMQTAKARRLKRVLTRLTQASDELGSYEPLICRETLFTDVLRVRGTTLMREVRLAAEAIKGEFSVADIREVITKKFAEIDEPVKLISIRRVLNQLIDQGLFIRTDWKIYKKAGEKV
jgi:hypothetical protein